MKNLYTKEEIILCTYIARFGRNEFSESDIHNLKKRSVSSIKMKVQNIASMLVENGYNIDSSVSQLTGNPPGKKGRLTNWDTVKDLAEISRTDFYDICSKII